MKVYCTETFRKEYVRLIKKETGERDGELNKYIYTDNRNLDKTKKGR